MKLHVMKNKLINGWRFHEIRCEIAELSLLYLTFQSRELSLMKTVKSIKASRADTLLMFTHGLCKDVVCKTVTMFA